MRLHWPSALVLFAALGALTTNAAAQSSLQPDKPAFPTPRAPLFSIPQPNSNVGAPEPQFQFHLPAHIVEVHPPQIAKLPPVTVMAESRCFTIRSYHYAPTRELAEAPELQGYSTCTPATISELHRITEPATHNR